MDRELLLEIGCEELPAGWLPGLTNQLGEVINGQLREHRLPPEGPVETFSTPRRMTVRVDRVPERQTDLEELVSGPPVASSFAPDGAPTKAATGFAAKQGVDVAALERVTTPKGEYLAFRKRQRGKTTVDVLPDVLAGALRAMTFPKLMHWDATLEDGRGELLFGRPIRWLLYVYGGRVVPFTITRSSAAQSGQVQDVTSGAVTYGHRFLTTSGRAGRAIKVRTFDDYRARLRENFVILERSARHDKIAAELDAKALRLRGRVSRTIHSDGELLVEVPDLVEYPSVIAGTFASEFTDVLPDEVLTTTLVHHQHYFPVEDEEGKLKPAFLAVINTEPDDERTIARNAERVVAARLRDAMFFWEADRRVPLESRVDRLATILFHKKLGTYREKAERIERLAAWIAQAAFSASAEAARHAARAARLAKADLATDMVREFTELQGIMGGIYAREEQLPEEVWKAVYFHYLPAGVEEHTPPARGQLGNGALTWAAVSLADKLDTIVGLFEKGERPTGSRDPYGLRRAGHGVMRILVDLQSLTGVTARPTLDKLVAETRARLGFLSDVSEEVLGALRLFLMDRLRHLMQVRGLQHEEVQAVTGDVNKIMRVSPADLVDRATALAAERHSPRFESVAEAFKRANNIVEAAWGAVDTTSAWRRHADRLVEPAESRLRQAIDKLAAEIEQAVGSREPRQAFVAIGSIQPELAAFFTDVRVMVDDTALQDARLALLAELRDRISELGDISVLAPKQS